MTLRKTFLVIAVVLVAAGVFLYSYAPTAQAACVQTPQSLGAVTGTFTISDSGTYRVWSRIIRNATDTSADSYILEIDDTYCNIVVGDLPLSASTWTWTDSRDGNATSKINVSLSAGTHTYKLYGREAGVGVDKLVFSRDPACVPTGTGDNCTVTPDTTPPTVSITSPTIGQTVSGTVPITATASDNVGVAKVEVYINGLLRGTDTSSPYSFSWVTTSYSNGSNTLSAVAYDAAGNKKTSTNVILNINNPTQVIVPGDVNKSGIVDVFDLSVVLANWNKTGATWAQGDVSSDSIVNVFDLSLVLTNWKR